MKFLPPESNFLGIEEQYSSFDNSKIVILLAPYEHTVSYGGGTKDAPNAIIDASRYVEFFDEEFNRELCFEKGIATLEPIEFHDAIDEAALDIIYNNVKDVLNQNKFIITLGGEHTISTAPIRAHLEKYPNICVAQFDAHSDLHDKYQGNKYSHASVMARTIEYLDPKKLVQVGIRAQCKEEYDLIKQSGMNTFYAYEIRAGKYGSNWKQKVVDTLADEVYITFDVDYFDPSIMPNTGTPEPGGFFWDETIELLRLIGNEKKIIGFDVVELSPDKRNIVPTYMIAKLVYKMLNCAF